MNEQDRSHGGEPEAAGVPEPASELALGDHAAEPKKRAPRKPKSKPQIESIEDLLKLAYESNARLLEFPKESLRKLPVTDEEVAAQGALIASLAPTDPTLSAPFKLLQYAARQGVPLKRSERGDLARPLARLVDLAVVALCGSPVFRVWKDQLLDPQRSPQLSTQHVRAEAERVDEDRLGLAPDQFKAADGERLVRNAVACYGLLRVLQRAWNLDQFVDESHGAVWKHEAPELGNLERAAGMIEASRDLDALGIVAANYVDRIARLDRQIYLLHTEVSAAANREARLREELRVSSEREQAALSRAEAFSADIVRLQKALAAEQDNRVVDKSHMADDYETLRTRTIRRLSGEIDLLTDGLHALRNGAPTVAEEFLDRSLLALTREVEQLKAAAGGLT